MGHAISLAVVPNVPLRVTRMGELSMWKGCAAAAATRAGIFAAQLAAEGMTGPFEPFEGRKGLWEQAIGYPIELDAMGGDDDPFRITDTIFKFYPSHIHTQAPIDLAIQLHDRVDVGDIASIKIQSYRSAVSSASTEPEKWDPKTRETADHSIPFLAAVGLRDGEVTPATFAPDRIADPGLRTIINKMRIDENAEFTERYPAEYNCRIEVIKNNGQTEVAETSFPKGSREKSVERRRRGRQVPAAGLPYDHRAAVRAGAGADLVAGEPSEYPGHIRQPGGLRPAKARVLSHQQGFRGAAIRPETPNVYLGQQGEIEHRLTLEGWCQTTYIAKTRNASPQLARATREPWKRSMIATPSGFTRWRYLS